MSFSKCILIYSYIFRINCLKVSRFSLSIRQRCHQSPSTIDRRSKRLRNRGNHFSLEREATRCGPELRGHGMYRKPMGKKESAGKSSGGIRWDHPIPSAPGLAYKTTLAIFAIWCRTNQFSVRGTGSSCQEDPAKKTDSLCALSLSPLTLFPRLALLLAR